MDNSNGLDLSQFRMRDPIDGVTRTLRDLDVHADIRMGPPSTGIVAGTDSCALAATVVWMLQAGWRVVVPPGVTPTGQLPEAAGLLRIDCRTDGTRTVRSKGRPDVAGEWLLGLSTSGSTGTPKLFGFTADQLWRVGSWYREVYGVTAGSLLVTSLPTVHNLALIAGVWTAAMSGATFAPIADPADVFPFVHEHAEYFDRVVVIANPVALESMLRSPRRQRENVLIDSGGAPLSRFALGSIRDDVGDIREGYGTTETLSLTHFDRSSGRAALGTVGRPLDGVRCRLGEPKPAVEISSPLVGTPLSSDLQAEATTAWVTTGDLGEITPDGNLRLVGRLQDDSINGVWPRDILDAIGPVLGYRTALVTQQQSTVAVTTRRPVSAQDERRIHRIIADRLDDVGDHNVEIRHDSGILYSEKLPRPAARHEPAC